MKISQWLDRLVKWAYSRHMAKTWPKRLDAARESIPPISHVKIIKKEG